LEIEIELIEIEVEIEIELAVWSDNIIVDGQEALVVYLEGPMQLARTKKSPSTGVEGLRVSYLKLFPVARMQSRFS